MNEKQAKFVSLRDTRLENERLIEEKTLFESKSQEMHPDDWKLKMESIKIEILKTRSDILKIEEDLGIDKNDPEAKDIEALAFAEIQELESEVNEVPLSEFEDIKIIDQEIEDVKDCINYVSKKVRDRGYNLGNIDELGKSNNPDERELYNEIFLDFQRLNIEEKLSAVQKKDPNILIGSLIPEIEDQDFKKFLLKDVSDNDKVGHRKIVDTFLNHIDKNPDSDEYNSLKYSIDLRLLNEKRKILEHLPIDEALEVLSEDPELLNPLVESILRDNSVKTFNLYISQKRFDDIKKLMTTILSIEEKTGKSLLTNLSPNIGDGISLGKEETILVLSGNMPKWIFEGYYSYISKSDFLNLVPENLIKEKSFHEDIINNESLFVESVNQILDKSGLTFKSLSPEEKSFLFRKGGNDVSGMYSSEDIADVLSCNFVDIDKIPQKYQLELKDSIIKSCFKYDVFSRFDNLEKLKEKLNIKSGDLSAEEKIKIMNLNDEKLLSLFEIDDFRNCVLNDDIKGLNVFNIEKTLDQIGLDINNLSEEKQIAILNERHYDFELVSRFKPDVIKRIILNESSNFQDSYYIEDLFKHSGVIVSELSFSKKENIFNNCRYSTGKIKNLFKPDDLKEIILANISNFDINCIPKEYKEILKHEIADVIIESKKIDFSDNKDERNLFFDTLKERYDTETQDDNLDKKYENQQKLQRIQRIQESFYFIDSQEKLPKEVLEKFNIFKEKYGKKGEGLMALSVVAYGLEDLDKIIKSVENIEKVLDLHGKENIPDGRRVTEGVEYEVGDFMAEKFDEESVMGYVNEAQFICKSADIKRGGAGSGAVFEFATKPTDNPYLLMVEIQLLQDAGFIDLNYKDFESASRGYHLNIGGETGLFAESTEMKFMHNAMTMASLGGLNMGVEVFSTKDIYQKTLDSGIFEKQQGGDRVEIKGAGCDSIEQFNKSIMTVHHACIGVQSIEKYLNNSDSILDKLPDNEESFGEYLDDNYLYKNENKFDSLQEKKIAYAWLKFKKDTLLAVRQHNDSFVDSECNGYIMKENGEIIDTGEHIDVNLNKQFLSNGGIDYNDSDKIKKVYNFDENYLFESQNSNFLRALSHVNNSFIFKEPILSEDKTYIDDKTGKKHVNPLYMSNAYSTLTRMNAKGYIKDLPGTPFDSIIENEGKIRDGYYVFQGASEEMISHKSQIIVNEFNNRMRDLLTEDTSGSEVSNKESQKYERAI